MDSVVVGRSWRQYVTLTAFFVVLFAGLYYVKWHPYYLRSFVAASKGSIGASIVSGGAAAIPAPSWDAAWGYAVAYGKAIWQAMVLGLLLGSGVQAALPRRWIERLFGRFGFGCVAAGGLAAIPGMMCTCCSAPVVVGLRRAKSSVGSALAFWLANPLLNPATLVFTGFVLGWHWVGLRLAFALLVVFGVAYLAEFLAVDDAMVAGTAAGTAEAASEEEEPTGGFFVRWMRELWRLSLRLLPEYVVIVLVLGAVRAWLFPALPAAVGNDVLWVVGLAIAGTAFVIPTAGEVPIIQSLMALGLGVGPAAALMVTLPAVSVPAAVMVSKVFPQRVVWFVAACVALSGVFAGLVAIGLGF